MKVITGTWKYADGTPVAGGRVFLRLSQDATALADAQIAPQLVGFTLDGSGSLPANTKVYFEDELNPAGTTYTVSTLAPGGGLVWGAESIKITGASPFNLNNAIPTTQNVLIANPVVTNPTAQQTINAFDLVMEGAAFGLSPANSGTGDTFLSRNSAGVVQVGTTDSNASGIVRATAFRDNSTTAGATGAVRVGNNLTAIMGRNAGNTLDIGIIGLDGLDQVFLGTLGGTTPVVVAAVRGPGFQKQVFTVNGTFTIPTGINQVKVTVIGGGGGGAGIASAAFNGSAGGGGGATAIKWLTGLTPGNTLAVTVGGGGAGGASGANPGSNGTNSTVASGTQTITTITGGGGNGASSGNAVGGVGGTGTNGDVNLMGGGGGYGYGSVAFQIPGGFGGGTTVIGPTAQGSGGNGANGTANTGQGGSGAANNTSAQSGGTGGSGLVIFEWVS